MKCKPILFSTPMVQAIMKGRKTMTRRVITPQSVTHSTGNGLTVESLDEFMRRNPKSAELLCEAYAPYQRGDILWVRETWFRNECTPDCAGREDDNECPFNRVGDACYGYKAQYTTGGDKDIKWRPSIFMPREAARIFLRVTGVRVEKLQKMPLFDVWDEGTPQLTGYRDAEGSVNHNDFRILWDSINAKRGYGWDTNPWVWVYSFERVDKPAGWPEVET